jgi:hypothetical protein
MFELYGIYDNSEIMLLVLIIVVIILLILLSYFVFFPRIEKDVLKLEKNIKNKKLSDEIDNDNDKDYKKKYEELLEEKKLKNNEMIKYSPSEFATLLKYNPILPYSAFTMDIINNAYLDFNEQSNFDDRYFSLNNFDNIYRSYNEPVETDTEDTKKMKELQKKIIKHKNMIKDKTNKIDIKDNDKDKKDNYDLNEDYEARELY